MQPPKIDIRFLIYTSKNIYLKKNRKNKVLNEKITYLREFLDSADGNGHWISILQVIKTLKISSIR